MKQKKIKCILKKLADTANALAEQDQTISRAQVNWLLEGCIVVLRDLEVSFSEIERAWHNDAAQEVRGKEQ